VSWTDAARYRIARAAGRLVTRVAAVLTLGKMPPFVSASAIVPRGDEILVVIDPILREPVLPGGHLRWTESPRHAVVREVREETGHEIEPGHLLGVYAGREWAGENGVVRVVFEGELRGGALRSSAEGEACWVRARDLAGTRARDAPIIRIWLERREGANDARDDIQPLEL
jgi:ADP-ribose pyrophosphatase YjhB (NUDIX family)